MYPVWLAGFLRLLFPEIVAAVKSFMAEPDWGLIDQARQAGWQKAQAAAKELGEILERFQGAEARTLARKVVIEPLLGGAAPGGQD